jgi:very-short-patch-repair endonuclease
VKHLGAIVASLAYGKKIDPKALEVFERSGASREPFINACGLCESPIEQIILARLVTMEILDFKEPAAIHDLLSGEEFPNKPLVVVPQFPIARFRLDFFVVVVDQRRAWQFDIECDGVEFHSSLERRQADFDRDTYLARIGIRTFRYTGQQIFRGQAHPEHDIQGHIFNVRDAA